MNGSAIVRWTGSGRIEDLELSVRNIIRSRRLKGRMVRNGGSIVVSGSDPVRIAELFRHLPGVRWLAVGFPVDSTESLKEGTSVLAKRYLRPGRKFVVISEVSGMAGPASDLTGTANFAILDAVRKVRTDESRPDITFRLAKDGANGAVGVQIIDGPGGNPSRSEKAGCLVSGGVHSSVLAWMTLVAGYSVELVHAMVEDESVRAVARLYAELSHRVDPTRLSIRVIEGGAIPGMLCAWVGRFSGLAFGGFKAGGAVIPNGLRAVRMPLWLLPEEDFQREFAGLALKDHKRGQNWAEKRKGEVKSRTYGGKRADVSAVLDGLR